ncbi:synaptotagmin-4-like [Prosopis cineraria]|uniref:synaptotagmin-4-like n=1 Tax=Prosopis cineraria TaxID=364024 RepID=UPI00241059DB|nr:synaptotagmin-4-like [Prosopis cineraria]
MGFISGMIMGIALGISLTFAFARFQTCRSKRRSDLAMAIAAFARMMKMEDCRRVIPPESCPPWVVFTRRQKLNWLNTHLQKIWPYVNQAASELIKSNVEPIVEQYTPKILSSITFSKFTLGTVAPQFTGVAIVEEESGAEGVTMELEMQWDGNPTIAFDAKTRVGVVIPVKVKDVEFTGVFRLIFKPLVNEFPSFAAVCYSLREKKHLDFTLKVSGGDISTLPGISDAIEETIRDAIEDSITWPVRKIIPIIPGDYSFLESKPVGMLEVKLVQAKNLANKDLIGKSDPFAVLFVRPLRDSVQSSKTINNELNPVWNENFEFTVEDASTQHLTVRLFDNEGIEADQLIGCAQVPLKDLQPGKVQTFWLKLVKDLEVQRDKKYRGEVNLELLYCPFGVESIFTNLFSSSFGLTTFEKAIKSTSEQTQGGDVNKSQRKYVIVRGVLTVTVLSAEDLPDMDLLGKTNAYVVLMLKKADQKLRTRVAASGVNPVWNQTFDFVVEDALHEMLILEVWDQDLIGKDKIGRVIMTLTRVILAKEVQESFALDGAKSGKLNLYLKWTPQHKYRDP